MQSMSDPTIAYASITELSRRLQQRELSPVTLTEAVLARAQSLQPHLNAFVTLTAERARVEAQAAEIELNAGLSRGPLHGIPYVAKDLFDVAGYATQAGCTLLADNVAETDAAVVQRLAAAGMILIGKTHTVQFAFGGVGINQEFGTPHNPWSATPYAPGGSSSGTAVAIAAGIVPMGLGSDTGGSVRIPASLCGITGLKTTVGRVSRTGVYPLSWTLDSVGPLARTAQDCALAYVALHGPDENDATTLQCGPHDVLSGLDLGVEGLRICFAETAFWEGADPAVHDAVRATGKVFEDLGARVDSVAFPEAGQVAGGERERHRALVVAAEGCAVNRRLLDEHFDELDPHVAHRMISGRELNAPDYFDTIRAWQDLQRSASETLRDVDAVIVPTCAIPARSLAVIDADLDTYAAHNGKYLRNTAIGNMLNLCGVSVPCGFDADGMPIGLMVYAKPFDEGMALRVAYAFEMATDWRTQRPDLSWAGG